MSPCSWDEAIAYLANGFRAIQARHGRDAIGVFGGGGLTNEKAYSLGKFARTVLRTRSIDYNGRFCMASAARALQRAVGLDRGLPFPLEDLASADVIFLAGANPAETMPPIMQYFDAQRARGGALIVADPRRSASAERATLHLPLAPGSDIALANALLHVVIRDDLIDHGFIAARTRGFEAVKQAVASYWPDRAERMTGVAAAQIVEAARLLGRARSAIVLTARGCEQQVHGVQNVLAYINLTLALGKFGRRGSGFGTLTGQGNGQGGREHGQKADQLPGYRRIDDPRHRREIAARWGIDERELPGAGPSACELLRSLGAPDGVRALLVMGANPAVSAPDVGTLRERLAALELLVVADFFLSETASLADVVLPVCQWAEESGTMTNLEGRLLLRRRALSPPDGVRTDLEVLKLLAEALGRGELMSDDPEQVFAELARASSGGSADYGGLSHARIAQDDALFWPCPDPAHPGTPRLFLERFATADGCGLFHRVEAQPPFEELDDRYPLYLTTGRVLSHYQSGVQTRRAPSLSAAEPEPFVELHPDVARSHGIGAGDLVTVETRRGAAQFRARPTPAIRLDTLFVPFHWGGPLGRANALTRDVLDPESKIPAFKFACAAIRRVEL